MAFNWAPIEDFTIRGTWGTSFRAPVFGELSPLFGVVGANLGQLATQTGPISTGLCDAQRTDLPPVGSGAWKIQSSVGNGMPGSATACSPALTLPAGISMNGGSGGAETIRAGVFQGWSGLKPELATNWGIGFEYAPTDNFLRGLNLQATYYVIKINGVLRAFGVSANAFTDPTQGFAFLVPTDWANSGLTGAAGCTNNLLPTTCAPFQEAVNVLLAQSGEHRRSAGQDADPLDQRWRNIQQGLVEARRY